MPRGPIGSEAFGDRGVRRRERVGSARLLWIAWLFALTLSVPPVGEAAGKLRSDESGRQVLESARAMSGKASTLSYALDARSVASATACAGQRATIVGTRRGETLRGTSRRDVIVARSGADRILGRGGDDLVCAGGGNDRVRGGGGSDVIFAGPGRDRLLGGRGLDLLDGGRHNDTVNGGRGWDAAVFVTSRQGVSANLAAGRARGDGRDALASVNAVIGSVGRDILRGNGGPNVLAGLSGSDTIDGAGGIDLAAHFFSPAPVRADLASGVSQGEGNDQLLRVEGLVGSDRGDTLAGDARGNILFGLAGADVLDGREGDDQVDGGAGEDTCDNSVLKLRCELTNESMPPLDPSAAPTGPPPAARAAPRGGAASSSVFTHSELWCGDFRAFVAFTLPGGTSGTYSYYAWRYDGGAWQATPWYYAWSGDSSWRLPYVWFWTGFEWLLRDGDAGISHFYFPNRTAFVEGWEYRWGTGWLYLGTCTTTELFFYSGITFV